MWEARLCLALESGSFPSSCDVGKEPYAEQMRVWYATEAITWNLDVIQEYEKEILDALDWLNKDLVNWLEGLNHLDSVIEKNRKKIE